jgi:hypothetical protein
MAVKKKLDELFDEDKPKKPVIRRGQGLKLSTQGQPQAPASKSTDPAESDSATKADAPSQKRARAKKVSLADVPIRHKRVNRGYKLREDLIKGCKRIALEEDRKLYEVMEEALAMYLARKQKGGPAPDQA